MKWSPGDSDDKKGTGTTGLANHIKKKRPTQYKEAMELTKKGGEERAQWPRQSVRRVVMTKNCKNKTHEKNTYEKHYM